MVSHHHLRDDQRTTARTSRRPSSTRRGPTYIRTYVVAVMAVAVAGVAAAVAIAVAVHTYTAQQSMARATRNIHGGSSDGDKMRVNNGTSSKKHPRW